MPEFLKAMNSRERFLIALNGKTPDRVPLAEYLFSLKLPFNNQS